MSDVTRDTLRILWGNIAKVGAGLAIAGLLVQPLAWLTGGIRSQIQIDLEALKAESKRQGEGLAALAARVDGIAASTPRSADIAGQLARLDSEHQALRLQAGDDHVLIREMGGRLQGLIAVVPPTKQR